MSAPTAGPWLALADGDIRHAHICLDEGQRRGDEARAQIAIDGNIGFVFIPLSECAAAPELVEALRDFGPACETLMDEVTGKRATDWGLVNDALCRARALLGRLDGGKS